MAKNNDKTRKGLKKDAKAELNEAYASPMYVVNLTNREMKNFKCMTAFYAKCGITKLELNHLCKDSLGHFCLKQKVSAVVADTLSDLFMVGTPSVMNLMCDGYSVTYYSDGKSIYKLNPIIRAYSMQNLMDSVDDRMTIEELPATVPAPKAKKDSKKSQKEAIALRMKNGELCPEEAFALLLAI